MPKCSEIIRKVRSIRNQCNLKYAFRQSTVHIYSEDWRQYIYKINWRQYIYVLKKIKWKKNFPAEVFVAEKF